MAQCNCFVLLYKYSKVTQVPVQYVLIIQIKHTLSKYGTVYSTRTIYTNTSISILASVLMYEYILIRIIY